MLETRLFNAVRGQAKHTISYRNVFIFWIHFHHSFIVRLNFCMPFCDGFKSGNHQWTPVAPCLMGTAQSIGVVSCFKSASNLVRPSSAGFFYRTILCTLGTLR